MERVSTGQEQGTGTRLLLLLVLLGATWAGCNEAGHPLGDASTDEEDTGSGTGTDEDLATETETEPAASTDTHPGDWSTNADTGLDMDTDTGEEEYVPPCSRGTFHGTMVISTPAKLEFYKDYIAVDGDLEIRLGDDFELPCLMEVDGSLVLDQSTAARGAFPRLTKIVGDLSVVGTGFESLDFPKLASIDKAVSIENSGGALTFQAPKLASIGWLVEISNNVLGLDLELPLLAELTYTFDIVGNAGAVISLPALTSGGASLTIADNTELELSLPALASIGRLEISGNEALFLALPALSKLTLLRISTSHFAAPFVLPALEEIATSLIVEDSDPITLSLPVLSSTLEYLTLSGLTGASTIDLPALVGPVKWFDVLDAEPVIVAPELKRVLLTLNFVGTHYVELPTFPSLTMIQAELVVSDNPVLTTISFTPGTSLNSLEIERNPALTEIDFSTIHSATEVTVLDNDALETAVIPGPSLFDILRFMDNDALTSVSAPQITTIRYLGVSSPDLAEISFPLLAEADGIGIGGWASAPMTSLEFPALIQAGGLGIAGLPALERVSCPVLTTSGSIGLDPGNLALTTLDLTALEEVDYLTINEQPQLAVLDLPALEFFESILILSNAQLGTINMPSGTLPNRGAIFTDNPLLSTCWLEDLIEGWLLLEPDLIITVSGNLDDCVADFDTETVEYDSCTESESDTTSTCYPGR